MPEKEPRIDIIFELPLDPVCETHVISLIGTELSDPEEIKKEIAKLHEGATPEDIKSFPADPHPGALPLTPDSNISTLLYREDGSGLKPRGNNPSSN